MTVQLENIIMNDGSRQFGILPQTILWEKLSKRISSLPGFVLTDVVTDNITEGWIDFEYMDNHFSMNDQFGEYWLFVKNPECSEKILIDVLEKLQKN